MTDRELLYIVTIAEERNVTHAAERLHVAQPSLTQCLRRIESELGCPLFVRRKYGLDPTPAGNLYVEMARDVLGRMERFRTDVAKLLNPEGGLLRLGASWYNTMLFLPEAVSAFSAAFPGVELQLTEKGTGGLLSLLSDHKLDAMLAHGYPREFPGSRKETAKDVRREALMDEAFCLVAHRRFALPEDLGDGAALSGMPFIAFNEGQRIRAITDFALANAGIAVQRVVLTQSFPGALELAERGVGLTILPVHYVRRNLAAKPVLSSYSLPSSWHAYWTTSMLWREGEYPNRLVHGLLPILRDAVTKLKADEP